MRSRATGSRVMFSSRRLRQWSGNETQFESECMLVIQMCTHVSQMRPGIRRNFRGLIHAKIRVHVACHQLCSRAHHRNCRLLVSSNCWHNDDYKGVRIVVFSDIRFDTTKRKVTTSTLVRMASGNYEIEVTSITSLKDGKKYCLAQMKTGRHNGSSLMQTRSSRNKYAQHTCDLRDLHW